jgi:cyclopropane-fatty-acyl-phospholipid synthase
MAEHFRDYLDPVVDTFAPQVLNPEPDALHRFYVKHGGQILEHLGGKRLLSDFGEGQKWEFRDGEHIAVLDIREPEIVIPAMLPRPDRAGDVGAFYTYAGDENGDALWMPDTERTTVPEDVRTGYEFSDDLVTVAGVLYRRTQALRKLAYAAASVMAPVRDRQAIKQWQEDTGRTKEEIWAHYDLSQEVYTGRTGMLDDRYVQYSSGYLPEGEDFVSLEELQRHKIDEIEHNFELDKADTLLEVGGGWGGLSVELALRNPNLHITSLTVSDEQLKRAQQRAVDAGVADRVTFLGQDYRDFESDHKFDRVVSVEMIEAVDWKDLDTYLDALTQFADPDKGIIKIQSINIKSKQYAHQRHNKSFANTAIFPGGVLTPRKVINKRMAERGWNIEQETELTRSYAPTLREWRRNLNSNFGALYSKWRSQGIEWPQIQRFFRGFNFYLAFSEAGFHEITDHLEDWQLMYKPAGRS